MFFSFSLIFSLLFYSEFNIKEPGNIIKFMISINALISIGFLYLSLLVSPLIIVFPKISYRAKLLQARRALGVSAFIFGFVHAFYAFNFSVGGFKGLALSPLSYVVTVTFGGISLFILFLLALTSFDYAVGKLTFRIWKKLHRLIYVAGVFILMHAFLLGSRFRELSLSSLIFYPALLFLGILEMLTIVKFTWAKRGKI